MKTESLKQRPMLRWTSVAVAAAVVMATAAHSEAGPHQPYRNAVADWNTVAIEAFTPTQGTNPLDQTRTFSVLHAAMHDALNAIEPRYVAYTPGLSAHPYASADAAVAAAARDVLMALIPREQERIDAAYADALAAIRNSAAKAAGIVVGQAAAAASLARRANDGAAGAGEPIYVPTYAPGDYQFTPGFDFAFSPGWGRVTPFVIDLARHRVPRPLSLESRAYALDFNYVKAVGRIDSRIRTKEQSEIARFWYEDSPLGWNRIANLVVRKKQLDPWAAARVLALVNFAMADGFIAGFAAKYDFRFWRPVTAIREAAQDGNRWTEPDEVWEPFMPTPPVPDYPSTHTVLGAAAAEVLIHLFGDRVRFSTTSTTLPEVTRRYKGFSQAALENGQSRIFAGIHFGHAVADGYQQGRSIGQRVSRALPPLR